MNRQTSQQDIEALYEKYLVPNYAPKHLFVRGRGAWLWDANGKRYLDFTSGIAVASLGHCHSYVVDAIRIQAAKLMHASNLYYTEPQARLAEKLSEISMGGKVFFCNSGAEANEALIKLARLWGSQNGGRHEIITFRNSFHGRTLATLTASGQDKIQQGFKPLPRGFEYATYNDIDSVKAAITDRTAAVLIEPVQGEGGVVPADVTFMRQLRELCTERKLLLMFDEVQTGIGRTGSWFGYQQYGVTPDALSVAKGLGGGMPIGAMLTAPEYSDLFQPGTHGTTFGGNPVVCAAARAVLTVIERYDLLNQVTKTGDALLDKLDKVGARYPWITAVRGKGLMIGLVADRPVAELEAIMMRRGLLSIATSGNVIRLLPPLNVTAAQVRRALRIIRKSCAEWNREQAHQPVAENTKAEAAATEKESVESTA